MPSDPRLPFRRCDLPDDVGPALRRAREGRGATRREVAARIPIAPRTLARIERGDQKPLWETLDRLCDELGVSVASLAPRWLRDSMDLPSGAVPGPGLRALRRMRGLTLERLAEECGVSAATLSRFERGLTASRRLARRVGGPDVSPDDRDLVLDAPLLARALGFASAAALHAACVVSPSADGEDPAA